MEKKAKTIVTEVDRFKVGRAQCIIFDVERPSGHNFEVLAVKSNGKDFEFQVIPPAIPEVKK